MNAKSIEILSQITVGTVLQMDKPWIAPATVSEITEKSVKFDDGTFTAKRSLFHYTIVR